jgi:hypothetical protein
MMAALRRVGEDREAQENVLFAAHRQGIIQMRRAVLAVALLISLAPFEAAAGTAIRSSSTSSISTTRRGSTGQETFTAMSFIWWNASRCSTPITSPTR